ncbi:MAG TPA: hypothetical protein VGD43_24100 [Micromonospora sp.]
MFPSITPRRGVRSRRAVLAALTLTGTVTALLPAAPGLAGAARADLVVTASANPTQIYTNGRQTTISTSLANQGTATANDVAVAIDVPAGATLHTFFMGEAWNCDTSAPTWICRYYAPLAPGESVVENVLFDLQMPPGADGTVTAVTLTASTTSAETATRNNTAKTELRYFTPPPADLALSDMKLSPTGVVAGDNVGLTLNVRNDGPGMSDPLFVRIDLPPTLIQAGANGSFGWNCSPTGAGWDCEHAPIAAGTSAEPLGVPAKVVSGSPGDVLTATATVTSGIPDPDLSDNSAQASTTYVATGTVRGQVWHDLDADGQREAGEPALGYDSGVYRVWINSPDGLQTAAELAVDPDGNFTAQIKPGQYLAEVYLEYNNIYNFTSANVGDDGTDSDVAPTDWSPRVGHSAVFEVVGGDENVIDIGLVG